MTDRKHCGETDDGKRGVRTLRYAHAKLKPSDLGIGTGEPFSRLRYDTQDLRYEEIHPHVTCYLSFAKPQPESRGPAAESNMIS